MITWSDLRREPFRLFFPLGILFGLFGANHWLFYALGWTQSYSGFYHASIQVGAYMTCFIAGFLLTALPRFASAAPATRAEFFIILVLCVTQPLLLPFGQWVAAEVCFLSLLLIIAVCAGRRIAAGRATVGPPTELVWIPIGLLHAIVGTSLLISGQLGLLPAWLLAVGRPMAQQGFLLSIVMGVGGFMAPRLMGHSPLLLAPTGLSTEEAHRVRLRRIQWHLVAGLMLFVSFWIEGAKSVGPAYWLRALVVTIELIWTSRFHVPPPRRDQYVQLLWLSLWMIVLGLWGAGLVTRFHVAMLHLVFLGGFSLMTFAVGTMVVLSHGGAGQQLRQRLWVLDLVAVGIGVALVTRVTAELLPQWFFPLLGLTALSWSAAGIGWLVFALPHALHQVPDQTFERTHEEATRHILKASF